MISDKVIEKVEEFGVIIEKFGRTPLEARVFSYLLLAEPNFQSFDEIREFLGASKSSLSNAINMFLREKTVTYKTFRGDRKRYFYINANEWENLLEDSARNMFAFNAVLEEVLVYRKDSENKDFNKEIKGLIKFQQHITKALEAAVKDWKSK